MLSSAEHACVFSGERGVGPGEIPLVANYFPLEQKDWMLQFDPNFLPPPTSSVGVDLGGPIHIR